MAQPAVLEDFEVDPVRAPGLTASNMGAEMDAVFDAQDEDDIHDDHADPDWRAKAPQVIAEAQAELARIRAKREADARRIAEEGAVELQPGAAHPVRPIKDVYDTPIVDTVKGTAAYQALRDRLRAAAEMTQVPGYVIPKEGTVTGRLVRQEFDQLLDQNPQTQAIGTVTRRVVMGPAPDVAPPGKPVGPGVPLSGQARPAGALAGRALPVAAATPPQPVPKIVEPAKVVPKPAAAPPTAVTGPAPSAAATAVRPAGAAKGAALLAKRSTRPPAPPAPSG